jgi:hypothetical protein
MAWAAAVPGGGAEQEAEEEGEGGEEGLKCMGGVRARLSHRPEGGEGRHGAVPVNVHAVFLASPATGVQGKNF